MTPDFNEKNYRFYKKGIRLTYEDVIGFAVEYTPKNESEEPVEEEESLGLWHKICWKKTLASFRQVETMAEERLNDIGQMIDSNLKQAAVIKVRPILIFHRIMRKAVITETLVIFDIICAG